MTGKPDSEIRLCINGENMEVPAADGLLGLIATLGLTPNGVLIEHNGIALLRDEWPQIHLGEGDRLEILRVVAGG